MATVDNRPAFKIRRLIEVGIVLASAALGLAAFPDNVFRHPLEAVGFALAMVGFMGIPLVVLTESVAEALNIPKLIAAREKRIASRQVDQDRQNFLGNQSELVASQVPSLFILTYPSTKTFISFTKLF